MAPETFSRFHAHADDCFSGNVTDGWAIDTDIAPVAGGVTVSPQASKTKGISLTANFALKELPSLVLGAKATDKGVITPTVKYSEGPHSVELDHTGGATFRYALSHPTFSANWTTNLVDGLSSTGDLSFFVCPAVAAGLSLAYDPSRSGLKKVEYGVVARKGSFTASATFAQWFAPVLALSYGLSSQIAARFKFSSPRGTAPLSAVAGLQYTSPCGATVEAHGDIARRTVGTSGARALGASWRVALSATSSVDKWAPQLGVRFTQL